uniref:VPS37C subunit of ESCRT-I n=1 Tax=Latimeria chalumnae TaxID=7897 RepID=H3AJ11_LATCH
SWVESARICNSKVRGVPRMENLRELSVDELKRVMEDSDKQATLVQESSEVQNIQLEQEMALATNRSLAEQNLEFQPRLESGKACLSERYQELQGICESCKESRAKLEEFSAMLDLGTMLALLQTEGAKMEEESEQVAENFLEGMVPLEKFLEEYGVKRKLAHQRRVRIEKLQELLRKPGELLPQQQAPAQAKVNGALPVSQPSQPQPAYSAPSLQGTQQPTSGPAPFLLPYSPTPTVPGRPQPVGPMARGDLNPAPFMSGPAVPMPPAAHQPRPSPGPAPAPYPMPYNQGPGFHQPVGPMPQQMPFSAPRGGPQCPYPIQAPYLLNRSPSHPPYPQYPTPRGFPMPSQVPPRPGYGPSYGFPPPFS